MGRTLRLIAAALAVSLFAAACGDDSSDAGSDSRSEEQRAADESLVETFQLTLDDLPAGWQAEPDDDDDSADSDDEADDSLVNEVAECLGVDSSIFDSDNPSAESPTFISPNQLRVQSQVAATPSEEWATERLALFEHELLASCMNEFFVDLFNDPSGDNPPPPGVTYGEPQVSRIPFADIADGTHAIRITIPATADDTTAELHIDMVMVRQGRFGITMTFQGIFDPFPLEQAEELTRTVVDRIDTASE